MEPIDPYIHKDLSLFHAIENLYYYLMVIDEDDYIEGALCAEIEVILEEMFHIPA